MYDAHISFVCEEGEDDEGERAALQEAIKAALIALHGRMPAVMTTGPRRTETLNHRSAVIPEEPE